jgi:acetyltransferase-like isoleucine patch superfamily enzyme
MGFLKKLRNRLNRISTSPEKYARKIGVKIGSNCYIQTYNFGSEPYLVTVGNHVQVTENVSFITHGGGWVFRKEIPDMDFFGKITVKDNVYIGTGSCILPGVTIESNVIIAAKTVVTKSIPEGVIVGGNPCRIIGKTEEYKNKILEYNLKTKNLSAEEKRKVLINADENFFLKKPYLNK